jgi:glutathionylspermidine synthase
MIYKIDDFLNNNSIFFVPDETTQISGQALNIPHAVWNIGSESDAQSFLLTTQQNWLNKHKDYFSVFKVIKTQDGNETWIPCDLDTQEDNTNIIYYLNNPSRVIYVDVMGLENAKRLFNDIEQEYLTVHKLYDYETLNELPPAYEPPKEPISQGTQTI